MTFDKKLDQMRRAMLKCLNRGDIDGAKKIRLQMFRMIQLKNANEGVNHVDDAG